MAEEGPGPFLRRGLSARGRIARAPKPGRPVFPPLRRSIQVISTSARPLSWPRGSLTLQWVAILFRAHCHPEYSAPVGLRVRWGRPALCPGRGGASGKGGGAMGCQPLAPPRPRSPSPGRQPHGRNSQDLVPGGRHSRCSWAAMEGGAGVESEGCPRSEIPGSPLSLVSARPWAGQGRGGGCVPRRVACSLQPWQALAPCTRLGFEARDLQRHSQLSHWEHRATSALPVPQFPLCCFSSLFTCQSGDPPAKFAQGLPHRGPGLGWGLELWPVPAPRHFSWPSPGQLLPAASRPLSPRAGSRRLPGLRPVATWLRAPGGRSPPRPGVSTAPKPAPSNLKTRLHSHIQPGHLWGLWAFGPYQAPVLKPPPLPGVGMGPE